MSGFHIYTLMRDHNRHHCICVAVERKYTYFVPMAAAEVKVQQLLHEEFRELYETLPEYPVRRAAEIFLAAPDKEVSPEAREHLEAILADPAYVYDRSLYKEPTVLKDQAMATAAKKAAEKVGKKKADSATQEAAGKAIAEGIKANPIAAKAAPAKKVAAAPAGKAAKKAAPAVAKGRTPAIDPQTRLKVGNIESVRGGYMKEFIENCQALEKASKGKGFTIEAAVEGGLKLAGAKDKDAAWVRTYVGYSMAPNRGILTLA